MIIIRTKHKDIDNSTKHNTSIVRNFINEKAKKSMNTATNYEIDIKKFFNVNTIDDIDMKMIKSVTMFDVQDYINYLVTLGRSSSTIHRKLTSLSSLYSWLIKNYDNSLVNIFANLKQFKPNLSHNKTEFMTKSETDKFLSSLKTETLLELRDKAIIYLMLSTGLKKSQILNIKLKDLANFNGNYFIVLNTIGKKGDIVKINSEIHDLIMSYIDNTGRNSINNTEDYLFKSYSTNKCQAQKLSPGSLNKMLKKNAKE